MAKLTGSRKKAAAKAAEAPPPPAAASQAPVLDFASASPLPVRIYDDAVLRETAKPIKKISDKHRELAARMAATMYEANGIGIAANQVGSTERLIIIDVDWSEKRSKNAKPKSPRAMINPMVLEESTDDEEMEEGCLSIPDIRADVWRPSWVRLRYTDLEGAEHEEKATELLARCIQHEIDHLDGRLFIDRLPADERRKLAGKLGKLRDEQKKRGEEKK